MRDFLDRLRPRHRLDDGYVYLKVSRPLDRYLSRELDKDPKNVHIFDTSPPVHDLSWLLPWRDGIQRLIVLDVQLTSVEHIAQFPSLVSLTVEPSVHVQGKVDASLHPHLEDLSTEGFVDFTIRGSGVSRVSIEGARQRTITELEAHEPLVELSLQAPRRCPIRLSRNLRSLTLSGANLARMDRPILGLEALESLALLQIRGIRDLSIFSCATQLKRLYLEDCVDLTTIDGPHLSVESVVKVVGKTHIEPT